MSGSTERWAWADIDHDALAHNVVEMCRLAAPAQVWSVVKADGYGHGAVEVARTCLDAGAVGLCVALTQEAVELRRAGIDAPILLLSQQPLDHAATIVEERLTPTVYDAGSIDALAAVAQASDPLAVHLKIDTGMQRVGAAPGDAASLAARVAAAPGLRLGGVFTHLAAADSDDPEHGAFTAGQLERLDSTLAALALDDDVLVHAANSAGTMVHPRAHRSLVRVGIAAYGISPGVAADHCAESLRPVLSLRARVSFVKRVAAGSRISYGLRHRFAEDTTVATVPIGYADGVPRRLAAVGGRVLVGGVACPIVGVVTMDQLMLDVGGVAERTGREVEVGDEVVLLGSQGEERVRAEDWATLLDTIGYEIVCGVSRRIGRRHHGARP